MTALLIGVILALIAVILAFPKAKIPGKIMTVLSEGVPMLSFIIVFVTFMLTIFTRYVIRVAIPWSYEVSILGYIYCMFFGSGIAVTRDEHVVFSLIYDKLKPAGKLFCKILYNMVLIALICCAFIPVCKSIFAMKQITGILKMPYKYIFAPYLWMLAEIVVRSIGVMIAAVKEYNASKNLQLTEGKEAEA